jgi:DNA primase
MSKHIDFRELRAQLDFEKVLRHYGVEVKRGKDDQHMGFCPLPNHNGKRNSQSFSANLKLGIFHCFGCGAKGNVLDFAAMMEKENPKDGRALYRVAAKLQKQFGLDGSPAPKGTKEAVKPKEKDAPRLVNVPLNFELKGLDPKHPYLLNRRFMPETIAHFGLGFCSRGYHKDRVAIPLHDQKGELVGYAGRVVDDKLITDKNPRYLLPGDRERDGVIYEFQKTLFLYNGFRIQKPVRDLIVVESFTSIWWLTQNDLSDGVGTMGADCSPKQGELIVSLVEPGGCVWIFGDGDDAGERHALSVMREVARHRFVRWIRMPDGKQPTDFSREELKMKLLS